MTSTITAIIGDFFHEESLIRESLEESVRQNGLQDEIRIRYAQYDQLSDILADKPDAVVLFMEDRLNPRSPEVLRWMSPKIAREIVDYVEHGGSWLGWHSGLASFEKVDEYIALLRGHFKFHPREHSEVTYTTTINGLGISEHIQFSFVDEHYFVECDEPNTNVFLRSSSRDGESIAGWQHSFGKGKVCCFTPAHTKEGLINLELYAVMGSILRWIVL